MSLQGSILRCLYRALLGSLVLCIIAASALASHTYDALGRRVLSEFSPNDPPNAYTIRYVYDGQRIIEERDGADALTFYHVNGAQYIDERVATYEVPGATAGVGGFTYYLAGSNYSVTGKGNSDGSVIERIDFGSGGDFANGPAGSFAHDAEPDLDIDLADFASLQICFGTTDPTCLDIHDFDLDGVADGVIDINDFDAFAQCMNGPEVPPLPGCAVAPTLRNGTPPPTGTFALHGRPIDVLADGKVLLYVRARFYDPQHGRWFQRDPSGYVDGGNLYESFRGNAARHVDPSGRDVWVTADARELTDATGREWWEITYTRHRNKLDVGYVFTFYQWWWGDWNNENFSETERVVEYFPRREGINIWNRIAAEQERLVDDFTANADAKAYRDAIVLAASAPIQIATAGTAQTVVASGAAKIGITSSTALGRIGISATTNALVTGAGEAGGTAVLVPFGEATLGEVGEAGLRGVVVGGITGGVGRGVFEASPTLQRAFPDSLLLSRNAGRTGVAANVPRVQANKAVGDAASDAIAIREAGIREATFTTIGGPRRVDVLTLGSEITAIESKVGSTALTSRVRQELARDWWLRRQGQVDRVIWEFSPNAAGSVGPTDPLRLKLEKLSFDLRVTNP